MPFSSNAGNATPKLTVSAQEVFGESDALELVFDGRNLDLRLSSSLHDVAVSNGDRTALAFLPLSKLVGIRAGFCCLQWCPNRPL